MRGRRRATHTKTQRHTHVNCSLPLPTSKHTNNSIAVILLETQDTLREPPAASVSMKKSVTVSMTTAMGFYRECDWFLCVCFGGVGVGVWGACFVSRACFRAIAATSSPDHPLQHTPQNKTTTVSVAVCGYAALGDAVGGDVIKSFVGVAPPWVVSLARAMVRCACVCLFGGFSAHTHAHRLVVVVLALLL